MTDIARRYDGHCQGEGDDGHCKGEGDIMTDVVGVMEIRRWTLSG